MKRGVNYLKEQEKKNSQKSPKLIKTVKKVKKPQKWTTRMLTHQRFQKKKSNKFEGPEKKSAPMGSK